MSFERKKTIYALAVKYDVIIVEDDRESTSSSIRELRRSPPPNHLHAAH